MSEYNDIYMSDTEEISLEENLKDSSEEITNETGIQVASNSQFGDIDSFALHVLKNPDSIKKEVAITSNNAPSFSMNITYNQGHNPGSTPLDMHFILSCKSLPIGSRVSVNTPQSGPNPKIKMDKSIITNSYSQNFGMVSSVPSNWNGIINCNYYGNGSLVTESWVINLQVVYFVNSDHTIYPFALSAKELNIPKNLISGIGPQKGIIIGSYKIIGQ